MSTMRLAAGATLAGDLLTIAAVVLLVPACWLIVVVTARVPKGAAIPLEQLGIEKPGAMSRGEKTTLALCTATALLWIFRLVGLWWIWQGLSFFLAL